MNDALQLATQSATTAGTFVGNFLALLLIAVIIFVFSLRSGKASFISLVISLYAGYALYVMFPYTDQIVSGSGTPLVRTISSLLIFGILSVLPFLVLRRIATGGIIRLPGIILFGLAFLTAGFLLALGYHAFGIGKVFPLGKELAALFEPSKYFFYWFIAPIVGLVIFAR